MNQALVGLGSNVEAPLTQLADAYRRLSADPNITVETASSVYLSAPHGPKNQPDFYNAAISLHTTMPPEQLLKTLLSTETKMGRKRSPLSQAPEAPESWKEGPTGCKGDPWPLGSMGPGAIRADKTPTSNPLRPS